MIVEKVERPVFTSMNSIQRRFRIDEAGIVNILSILRKNMYSNPVRIIVQEYSSNARDAHTESGIRERPIQITCPTSVSPHLKIRDYGGGITPERIDGCFVAYKYVNDDFSASHDHTYKNHPGNVLSMDRDLVDADSSRTCSRGLHVAAWDYVKNSSTIVSVKVNPADVVSIPYDYNGQKMRVCRYQVIDTITGEFNEPRFSDEPVNELDRERFEYLGIHGSHKELGTGAWMGTISHKHRLLDGVSYHGNSLNELYKNFITVIDEITKDTRFNYLRQRRDGKGGFLKTDSK